MVKQGIGKRTACEKQKRGKCMRATIGDELGLREGVVWAMSSWE